MITKITLKNLFKFKCSKYTGFFFPYNALNLKTNLLNALVIFRFMNALVIFRFLYIDFVFVFCLLCFVVWIFQFLCPFRLFSLMKLNLSKKKKVIFVSVLFSVVSKAFIQLNFIFIKKIIIMSIGNYIYCFVFA